LDEDNITEKIMIININRTYRPGVSPYEATRKYWRININRAKQVDYILSEFRGIIRAIYKPIQWVKHHDNNRFYFEGIEVDSSEIKHKYLNKAYQGRQRGAANPIRYLPKWIGTP
jgi:uncharacterized protein